MTPGSAPGHAPVNDAAEEASVPPPERACSSTGHDPNAPDDAQQDEPGDALASPSHERNRGAASSDPLAALKAIAERWESLASAVTPSIRARIGAELATWCEHQLSPEGLLVSWPWETFRALPVLDRFRRGLKGPDWSAVHEAHFARVVESTLRTATDAGWLMVPPTVGNPAEHWGKAPWQALAREKAFAPITNVIRWLWGIETPVRKVETPTPGLHSDAAAVAVLRRDWSRLGATSAVDFSTPDLRFDLRVDGAHAFQGVWDLEVRVGSGRGMQPLAGEWESTCWYSDSDGEYLELRRLLGGGLVLERQWYLARRLPLLWLSDTLKSPLDEPLELTWRFAVPGGGQLAGRPPTRAQQLEGNPSLRLLPVAAPANPLAASDQLVHFSDGRLQVSAKASGRRLFLPLVILWGTAAQTAPVAWRSLTVTRERRRCGSGDAVAYRIPVGETQFVFFRNLGPPGLHTFLGYQTRHECVVGEFLRDGTMQEWMLIEPSPTP